MALSLDDLTERFDRLFCAWERAGRELYLVGGCVRDVMMAHQEVGDIDMTTDAHPSETIAILKAEGLPVYPIGERFGTISTLVDGTPIEITTFRVEEQYERGNRKPNVTFGRSLRHDLSRRDLSINAMAAGRGGKLHDPFGGQRAIEERILEVPGGGFENTVGILQDDPLRLLRIARFCARFGFEPTPETTAAAQETAEQLEHISRERWKMEIDKTLIAEHVHRGLRWLHHVGAWKVLFPTIGHAPGADERVIDAVARTDEDRITRWAVIFLASAWLQAHGKLPDLHGTAGDFPEPAKLGRSASRNARRFRFSNEERAHVRALCEAPVPAQQLCADWDRVTRRRFLAQWGDLYAGALALGQAWAQTDDVQYQALRTQMQQAYNDEDVIVRLPRGFGQRVLDELQIPRGPQVSETIETVRQAIIDGALPNGASSEVYLDFLRHRIPNASS